MNRKHVVELPETDKMEFLILDKEIYNLEMQRR